jgi:hypothetical protein
MSKQKVILIFLNKISRILGLWQMEQQQDWGKFECERLNKLYIVASIIWVIKQRRMRWSGYVTWSVETRNTYKILVGWSRIQWWALLKRVLKICVP